MLDDLDREPQDCVDHAGGSLDPDAVPIRFVFDIATVNASFNMLETILEVTEVDLVALIALLHLATYRYSRRGFDEACFLSWVVCEQLMRARSNRHELSKASSSIATIATRLLDRGLLPQQLFDELKNARQSRNDWTHKLSSRQPSDVVASFFAAESLIAHFFDVRIRLPHGYPGGAVWFSDRLPVEATSSGEAEIDSSS